ncbi:response regulator transcription factor [Kutzneria sp. CA-103260]|uniref:response regulator transcription factor n=1 Tax=Kutzneria sp. CA-103260 TaxID=2802641 RepID=UPI001BA7AEEC|nr:response regulator transcription factor [Kutzneria sp. CA-103260]QUQ72315.1 LuxR family transcriptional regulator [Kutzneria sp. CA-103260]
MEPVALRVVGPEPIAGQIAVRVVAPDAIGASGLSLLLRSHPRIVDADRPDVVVFSATRVDADTIRRLRDLGRSDVPIVLLADTVSEASLLALIECGVVGIVDRGTASGVELTDAVLAAAARESVLPKELMGKLIGLVRTMQRETLAPLGLNAVGLTEREVEVLRLLADGAETAEIARQLTYSESTIKHVLHTLSTRFKFRNRVHAVAFALRAGVL